MPDLCLAGRLPQQHNAVFNLDLSAANAVPGAAADVTAWPEFHNGVAAGMHEQAVFSWMTSDMIQQSVRCIIYSTTHRWEMQVPGLSYTAVLLLIWTERGCVRNSNELQQT